MIEYINLEPDDMDDLLDDIEEFYHIRLTGGEVVDTAGALEELVRQKANQRRIRLGGAVIDVFNRLRTAMLQIPGIHANIRRPDKSWKVTPATPLDLILKGQDRHKVWHVLKSGMGMHLPRMRLSKTQFFVLLFMLFTPLMALGLTAYVLNYNNTIEWTILTVSLFPPLVAITIGKRIAKSLPADCQTMADLSAYIVLLNLQMLKSHNLIDMDLFDQIRRLIGEHANCPAAQIERTTVIDG